MAAPVFRARATTLFRAALVLLFLLPLLLVGLLWLLARSPLAQTQMDPVQQPILFDHRHHVGDDGIDCRYCHYAVETSPSAGFPETGICMNCHGQVWNRSPITDPIRAHYFENRPIAWQRVNRMPMFVFFNHAIHVGKGVGCVECHGRVDLMPAVVRAESLTMSFCIECHRDPTPRLRPLDQIVDLQWKPPRGEAGEALRQQLANQYEIHPPTDCYGCHR